MNCNYCDHWKEDPALKGKAFSCKADLKEIMDSSCLMKHLLIIMGSLLTFMQADSEERARLKKQLEGFMEKSKNR